MTRLAMISQPMNGLSEEEIRDNREQAVSYLQGKGYEVIDTYISDEQFDLYADLLDNDVNNSGLAYLGISLVMMSQVDCVYFMKGWEQARGCVIEHKTAVSYNVPTLLYE